MSADFLDSNVFLYLFDPDVGKQRAAEVLVRDALHGSGVISFQVVQETLNTLARKVAKPLDGHDRQSLLKTVLVPLWKVNPSEDLYARAMEIQQRYRYSFYDSLIIAAALAAGCNRLMSEDFQSGQKIETLTIVNPFSG
ncbi:MAG: PIN domain-containing protein [Tepidiformaceae bacterium]